MRRYDQKSMRREDARQVSEPLRGYSLRQVREHRQRIREIHRAGIEGEGRLETVHARDDGGRFAEHQST